MQVDPYQFQFPCPAPLLCLALIFGLFCPGALSQRRHCKRVAFFVVLVTRRQRFQHASQCRMCRIVAACSSSPFFTALRCRSLRYWRRSLGAFFSSASIFWLVTIISRCSSSLVIWRGSLIFMLAFLQSQIKSRGSRRSSSIYFFTLANSQRLRSQIPTSGLYSMWHCINYRHWNSEDFISCSNSWSHLFIRNNHCESESVFQSRLISKRFWNIWCLSHSWFRHLL